MPVTTIPQAGHRGVDSRDTFVTKQEAFQDALTNVFVTEINALETNVNAKEASAVASASTATTKANAASASATLASAVANYKGLWVAGYNTTGYSQGMSVGYSDGYNYVSNVNNNLAEPVTKTNTANWNWIEAVDPSELNNKLNKSGGTMTGAITSLRETSVAMGANNIDLSLGNVFTKTITGATTLTVSNVPASGNAIVFVLKLTNGGAGAVTYPSGTKWSKGTAPTLTASGVDLLRFITEDGGTNWYASRINEDAK